MKLSPSKPQIHVIFATSVFGEVHNGPALYANYLWHHFKDDPQIKLHLVTPKSQQIHPRIHLSEIGSGSRELYKNLQLKAIEVAKSLGGHEVIIHSNNAHCMALFKPEHGYLIGQINDYDAARSLQEPLKTIIRGGLRRFVSLVARNYNESQALKKINLCICNSRFVLEEVKSRYSNSNNLTVIYKGIDVKEFPRHTTDNEVDRAKTDLLFVGSNWLGKGLEIAIKVIAQLPQRFDHINLKVAGKCVSAERRIFSLVSKLGLKDRIVFLGHVKRENLHKVMTGSSLLLFPSHNEALGVAVIEAIASGLPVIAANTGGIPEILKRTKCSKLIETSVDLFTKETVFSLEHYPSQIEINEDRSTITQQFNIENTFNELKKSYIHLAQP